MVDFLVQIEMVLLVLVAVFFVVNVVLVII